jgi:hypothetical protein
MRRTTLAILSGAALGLVIATGLGLAIATLHSFASFRYAVRPGEKAIILSESISDGMTCWASSSILLVPIGAVVVWRRLRTRGPSAL